MVRYHVFYVWCFVLLVHFQHWRKVSHWPKRNNIMLYGKAPNIKLFKCCEKLQTHITLIDVLHSFCEQNISCSQPPQHFVVMRLMSFVIHHCIYMIWIFHHTNNVQFTTPTFFNHLILLQQQHYLILSQHQHSLITWFFHNTNIL